MLNSADFSAGLWIRTLVDIPSEMRILIKRKEYDHAAWCLSHTPAAQADALFTPYSPAHFMADGVNAQLFKDKAAGIIFKHKYRPAFFYDGCHGERLTRADDGDLDYTQEILNNRAAPDHQLRYPSSAQIRALLQRRYEIFAADSYYTENPDELPELPWNEGLLRYGFENIQGIFVNLDSADACKQALLLRDMLDRIGGLPFEKLCFYQFKDGHFIHTRIQDIERVATTPAVQAEGVTAMAATLFRRRDEEIRLRQYDARSQDSMKILLP